MAASAPKRPVRLTHRAPAVQAVKRTCTERSAACFRRPFFCFFAPQWARYHGSRVKTAFLSLMARGQTQVCNSHPRATNLAQAPGLQGSHCPLVTLKLLTRIGGILSTALLTSACIPNRKAPSGS
jgi:hypothetical protein